MGCTDFELNLDMAPTHAYQLGLGIGFMDGVDYRVDGFGVKVFDAHNLGVSLMDYVKKLSEFAGVPRPIIQGVANETLMAGFVEGVTAKGFMAKIESTVNA